MSDFPAQPVPSPPIGIDLGTTYSVVAYLDAMGRPCTIPNGAGDLLTPSAISFEAGQVVVGKEAVKASVFEPALFADCFKRDMGARQFRRVVARHEVPPEVLSAFVLERLKAEAEHRIGPVRQAVITVPAFFDETRRRATQEAGRLAGLEVLDIINEPTAAAIAYGYYHVLKAASTGQASKPRHVMVYDLGGGTFDVTVLQIEGTLLRTLATDGDVLLGGKDFDERLVSHVAGKFTAAHGTDPRSDPHDAAQLWLDVQDAKHTLSERTKVVIPCFHGGIRMRVEVSREEFAELTRDLLERTETTTQLVLRQAKLGWNDIDRVLLVGGASRMPMVLEMLRRISGKEADRSLSPDEAVAHGAAIYAGILASEKTAAEKSLSVVNVNSHSLGIVGFDKRTNRRRNVKIIPKNSPLPCHSVRRFSTARDGQSSVKIAIVEGESERPEHCIQLGECVVRNLPPGLPKGTSVEVEYRYAANGRISVVARVPTVRQSASVEIRQNHLPSGLSLEQWKAKLCHAPGRSSSDPDALSLNRSHGQGDRDIARLDALLVEVGKYCAARPLGAALQSSQAAVHSAWRQIETAKQHLQLAGSRQSSAIGRSESIQASAVAAKAKEELQQAETQFRYALLDLGRKCLAAGTWPAEANMVVAEIQRLQRTVEI